MSTDIAVCIAVAILLGLPFDGIVIYMRGAAALFSLPRSRVAAAMFWSIIIAQLVVSLGVLTLGGWWHYLVPWCGLVLNIYFWIRGTYLLSQPSQRLAESSGGRTLKV
jgi:hypothetical protein